MGISACSALLDVAPKTLRAMAKTKRIPAFKIGKRWKFNRAAIQEWLDGKGNGGKV
jgi:excisionase family DNA binding protein